MKRKYQIHIEEMADGSKRYRVQYNDGTNITNSVWRYVINYDGEPKFDELSRPCYAPFDFPTLEAAKQEIDRDIEVRKSITVVNQTVVSYP